jgi:hypothetical protein
MTKYSKVQILNISSFLSNFTVINQSKKIIMKKVLLFATAALLISGVSFANTDKGKKKKCAKGKSCCQKAKECSKDKKTAEM